MVTTGMFARPFGYEINLSSSDREAPERGRASQILMKTERDLGIMFSLEPRKRDNWLKYLELDAGFFNGQGLTSPQDFDSYKDFIGQVMVRPVPINAKMQLGGGISLLYGGFRQFASYAYRLQEKAGIYNYAPDSTTTQAGDKLPRRYLGFNSQWKLKHGWGATEIRFEYWKGTQTGLENSSETPGEPKPLPSGSYAANYIRPFDAGFLVFLQNIVNRKHQLGVKFDWYDPNSSVSGQDIGISGSNLNAADIRYTTLGLGYLYYMSDNIKLTLWYDRVWNESTRLPGYIGDVSDNILTARIQFRF
jgi:hypothetical protein